MKLGELTTAVDIARPRQVVATYATDPLAQLAFVARFLGRTLSYTYEVIDFIPAEQLIMATTEGPLRVERSGGV
jgi:hypothetical protein